MTEQEIMKEAARLAALSTGRKYLARMFEEAEVVAFAKDFLYRDSDGLGPALTVTFHALSDRNEL